MKIHPRYGTDPLITYEGDPAGVAAPAVRQRMRLAQTLAGFGAREWEAPSRCAGWTNRDVVVHLASTNQFWIHAISQARLGSPSRLLADFDPVATPAALVAAARSQAPAEVLDAYVTSTSTLVDLLSSLTSDEWAMLGESPLGHVSVGAIVRHALWDAWIHERDICVGVGIVPPVEADEIDAALRFAAAIGPAFGILLGDLGDEPLAATVTTEEPSTGFTITVGREVQVAADVIPAARVAVHGCAVDVLEGLSLRGPLHLEPEWQWLTAGLAHTFEARPRKP